MRAAPMRAVTSVATMLSISTGQRLYTYAKYSSGFDLDGNSDMVKND